MRFSGASAARAWAAFRLVESRRKLPTRTAISLVWLMGSILLCCAPNVGRNPSRDNPAWRECSFRQAQTIVSRATAPYDGTMRGTEFGELSAFMAVAEQRNFTRAAKQLGISPATLSET